MCVQVYEVINVNECSCNRKGIHIHKKAQHTTCIGLKTNIGNSRETVIMQKYKQETKKEKRITIF